MHVHHYIHINHYIELLCTSLLTYLLTVRTNLLSILFKNIILVSVIVIELYYTVHVLYGMYVVMYSAVLQV